MPRYAVVARKPARKTVPARSRSTAAVSEAVAAKAIQKVMNSFGATPAALAAANKKRLAAKRDAMSSLGKVVGASLGGYLGGPGGAAIGTQLGSYAQHIGRIFGSGDYVTNSEGIKENSVLIGGQIPSFSGTASTTRIKHREYLGDILTSSTAGAFSIQSYALNPGIQASFPWLSQVCGSTWQQYRINGMIFEFRSMSANALNSTNTALGSVVMCTDYDSKDAVFTSKQQMENTLYGVSCKPSSSMVHAIECQRSQTAVSELYVRASDVPSGADIRLYDLGRFSIATVGGQAANVNLGELWVSYDITLFKPIEQPPGYLNDMLHYNLAATDATKPLKLDTSVNATQPAFSNFPGTCTISDTALKLPLSIAVNSVYQVIWFVRGGSTASVVAPTITYTGGLTTDLTGNGFNAVLGYINGTSTGFNAPQTATGTTACVVQVFAYIGGGTLAVPPTLTFSTGGTFPGATVQGGDLYIMQIPSKPA